MTLIRRTNDLFPTFFDDFFGRDLFESNRTASQTMPAVNIRETEDDYVVEMVSPGLNKKDFKVELDNQTLTISYEKEVSKNDKEENYTKKEFSYSSFQRSFTIPKSVESNKIEANYKDGILNITIPKKEEAKKQASRLIAIS
ncbi:Hsp20/alpha crystallin family protein [Fulvivirga lutimaris]|uniref:Hsp20/alpha crystallin family protein n=1 Tax=Fulvivirga lutimaris TaxID=1819566 RepID=UPI0012BBB612|nr:Hsp20/alpha crystallin family protein [Fulvivirga lutimaris]MTI38093.1 Hsp20/alpha crystallin family protein [Fulvivirga lutimaris]